MRCVPRNVIALLAGLGCVPVAVRAAPVDVRAGNVVYCAGNVNVCVDHVGYYDERRASHRHHNTSPGCHNSPHGQRNTRIAQVKASSATRNTALGQLKPPPAPNKPAFPSPLAAPVGGQSPTYCVAFSPDGKRLAVGAYKRVSVYDTESGKRVLFFVGGADAVRALAWSPDGKRIAAGGGVPAMGGTVVVVDALTGKPTRTMDRHTDTVESLAFSGNTILSAADDETVAISDLTTGKNVGTLREHVGRCLSVAVPAKISDADGGAVFVTGGADNMVKVWDAGMRRVVVNFDQATAPVWSVAAFNRPGRFIAASADGHLRWHNVRTETERQLPNGDKEPIVPPKGEPQPRSGYIERDIMAHEGGAYSVATSPTDTFLVSGGADGKVVVWRNDGNKVREWTDAAKDIIGVAVSPDGKRIASASLDGVVRVYDAEKGAATWRFPAPASDAVGSGTGLTATYWNNIKMEGAPILTRVEGNVDFVLTGDTPIAGVPKEQVSARFEGFFESPATGKYTFITRADDGVRLFLDNKPVIDAWTYRAATEDRTKELVALKKGQRVAIRLEYYQGGGSGEIHLLAEREGKAAQTIAKSQLHPVKSP